MPKPIASPSLDLDNQWSYMKTHGDLGGIHLPCTSDHFGVGSGTHGCQTSRMVEGIERVLAETQLDIV